ncbi:hypothetical protein BVY03_03110 [bacterium K02(2017)]|nr:hypothetical protein BVY03_03110 [bacterium K02(2017)]
MTFLIFISSIVIFLTMYSHIKQNRKQIDRLNHVIADLLNEVSGIKNGLKSNDKSEVESTAKQEDEKDENSPFEQPLSNYAHSQRLGKAVKSETIEDYLEKENHPIDQSNIEENIGAETKNESEEIPETIVEVPDIVPSEPKQIDDLSVMQSENDQETEVLEDEDLGLKEIDTTKPVFPPPAPPKDNVAVKYIKDFFSTGNVVVKVGIIILFIGFTFLIKFAADQGLFPIELRIIGIALIGIVLTGLGWRLRNKKKDYALVLQGGGVAIFYLDIFAAFRIFELIPSAPAMLLLVVTVVCSVILAVGQDSKSLAVMALSGGFLAPILTSTGSGNYIALFTFYAILNAGIFGIAWFKAWRFLNILGFFFTFGIGSIWGLQYYKPPFFKTTEPFLILFFLFYTFNAVLFALKQKPALKGFVDGSLVFGTPLVVFSLQYGLVKDFEYGLAYSAFALGLFYITLASVLIKKLDNRFKDLIESFLAIGVCFSTLTIPLACDAQWTSALWALEGAGLVWIGVRQQRVLARFFGSLLIVTSGFTLYQLLSVDSITAVATIPIFNGTFLGCLVKSAAAIFAAFYLNRFKELLKDFETVYPILLSMFGLFWWYYSGVLELKAQIPEAYANMSGAFYIVCSIGLSTLLAKKYNWHLFKIVSVIFAIGTVPFTMDIYWISLLWSLIGFWLVYDGGKSQQEQMRLMGVGLLFLAGVVYSEYINLVYIIHSNESLIQFESLLELLPILNIYYISGFIRSFSVLLAAYLLFKLEQTGENKFKGICRALLLWGFAQWYFMGQAELYVHGPENVQYYNVLGLSFIILSIGLSEWVSRKVAWQEFKYFSTVLGAICVPFVMDHYWTSFFWSLLGLRQIWKTRKLGSQWIKNFGIVLLLISGFIYAEFSWSVYFTTQAKWDDLFTNLWPVINIYYISGIIRSLSALAASYLIYKYQKDKNFFISYLLLFWGIFQWLYMGVSEFYLHGPEQEFFYISLIFVTLSLAILEYLRTRINWALTSIVNLLYLPALAVLLIIIIQLQAHPFINLGYLAWPIIFSQLYWFLYRYETISLEIPPQHNWIKFLHAGTLWYLIGILSWELSWQTEVFIAETHTWVSVIRCLIPALFLFFITTQNNKIKWPLLKHAKTYMTWGVVPVVVYILGWNLYTNYTNTGLVAPIPYFPILNPIDLTILFVFLATIFWLLQVYQKEFIKFSVNGITKLNFALAFLVFIWINAILIRTIHQWAGVAFDWNSLYESLLVQMSLSIYWCLIGMVTMIYATRKSWRVIWISGAVLLGIVVLKLIFIDYANRGNLEPTISTIVIGLLFVITGYFSPIPPVKKKELP